ncbi:hypothetical protein ABN150_13115 [Klebsiella oxytoca]|uniref:hypothetical protein n=1 Tax=Klebsiella oxytoca TaxID=571 RepID=UPI0032DBDA98
MNDITELAQRVKTEASAIDDTQWYLAKPSEIRSLVEALEKAQDSGKVFQQSFFRQSLMYDVVAEAYEEAKEQIAKDVEIKARLCRESNSLFDRLRVAEKRIAELESRTVTVKQYDEFQICHYGATEDYAKGYIDCQNNFFKWLTAAGIKWDGE